MFRIIASADDKFFDLVKILDADNIKYNKTTFSFNIERGVVIDNTYLLKVVGDNFIYGKINDSSTYETSDFSKVEKWFDSIVSKISKKQEELEKEKKKKEQPKVLLKDLLGEAKQIEQIRRKIEKDFPKFTISENKYPCRIKNYDKSRNTFTLDYKNKVYCITKVDKDGFVMGRTYRTTSFEKFLESAYNHVCLDEMEFKAN